MVAAYARLHEAVERTLAEIPDRDRRGRFQAKPKPRDVITLALRAQYGANQSAVASVADAVPPPSPPASELYEEAAADTFYDIMMVIEGFLAVACFACASTFPEITLLGRIVLVAMGIVCAWCSYRCLP